MEILQLVYFKALARSEHMTRTAKKLNVSQPALSKTISRLEEELGVPLFDRVGRRIFLNEYGKIFLTRVDSVFHELTDGEREIQDLANKLERTISIAILLPHILPAFIGELSSQYPDAFIHQYSSSRGKTIKQLQNFEIDFCIISGRINDDNIAWEPLCDERIFLTVSKNHKYSHRKSIRLEEAREESFIGFNEKFEFRGIVDDYCMRAGFKAHTKIELEDPFTILKLVEAEYGVAITPLLPAIQKCFNDTIQIPIIHPKCTRTIGIAWNKNHYLSKFALECKEFTKRFFDNLNDHSTHPAENKRMKINDT